MATQPRRYPLEIWLHGRPVPDNRLKERFIVVVNGRRRPQTRYTPQATTWMAAVEAQATQAIQALPAADGRPSDWALPLQLAYEFVRVNSDLANCLKGLNDALQHALAVDDGYFEYDRIVRSRRGREPEPPPTLTARPAPIRAPDSAPDRGAARGRQRSPQRLPQRKPRLRAFVGVVVRVRPADPDEALEPQPASRAPRLVGHQVGHQGGRASQTDSARGATPLQRAIASALAADEASSRH
jgi:hypothetical protein